MRMGVRKCSLGLLLIVILMGAPISAAAQDFQSWNEVDLTASWRRANFLVPVLTRLDTKLPNPQLVASGVMVDFRLPWRLTLTGGYLFADLPQRSEWVHLPLVALYDSIHPPLHTRGPQSL